MSVATNRHPTALNMRQIAGLDIAGGGQVVVQGNHAFIGQMSPPDGT